jgi:hypothetical protein
MLITTDLISHTKLVPLFNHTLVQQGPSDGRICCKFVSHNYLSFPSCITTSLKYALGVRKSLTTNPMVWFTRTLLLLIHIMNLNHISIWWWFSWHFHLLFVPFDTSTLCSLHLEVVTGWAFQKFFSYLIGLYYCYVLAIVKELTILVGIFGWLNHIFWYGMHLLHFAFARQIDL